MGSPLPISQAYQPGRPVVAIIKNPATGQYWNTSTLAFEAYTIGNATLYQIPLTDPNGIGDYSAPFPSQLAGYVVNVLTYDTANMTNPIGQTELSPPDTAAASVTPTSPAVVAVVNKALMFLGVGTITSLDEDSEAANRASQIYASVLDATLRSHFWKFATYVEIPALLSLPAFDSVNDNSGNPIPGWEFAYAYPPNCLMLRKLFDPTVCGTLSGTGFIDYTFDYDFMQIYDLYKDILFRFEVMQIPGTFGKCIASHVNPAYIEYTYRIQDPTMWDMYFTDAMSWSLAAQLARTLTGNTDLGMQAQQMFTGIVSEAKRLDSQESRNRRNRMSSFQKVRM